MKPPNLNHMKTYSSSISSTVMRRVHVVHAVRPFLSGTALGSLLFLLAVWGIGREVWVSHVVQNLEQVGFASTINFLVSAFLNTRFIVQALTLIAAGALVYTVSDFFHSLRTAPRFS